MAGQSSRARAVRRAEVGTGSGQPADPLAGLSVRARAMRLRTVREARVAVLRQADRWWGAPLYHCPVCDRNFGDDQQAARHLVDRQHPVLRWDGVGCWA